MIRLSASVASSTPPVPKSVLHLWGNYFSDLFDHSHRLCLDAGWNSFVVARTQFDSSEPAPPHVISFLRGSKAMLNSNSFFARVRRRLLRSPSEVGFSLLTRRSLRRYRPAVVHCHFGTTGVELVRWSSFPRQPTVVSFYGVDASASLHAPHVVDGYRKIAAQGAIAHVLCDAVAQRLEAIGWPRAQIFTANLPAEVEDIPALSLRGGSGVRLLVPARFVEKKGHLVLLEALKTVLRERQDVTVTCFGYGPDEWLRQAVRTAGLSSFVTIVNNHQASSFREQYVEMLRDHDIVVAPSIVSSTGDDEGGPALTVVMAQAAGRPVIASDFAGSERSITNGVEGLVTPSGNTPELARAILSLSSRPDAWKEYGAAGRARVLAEFSKASYWRNLQHLYQLAISADVGRRQRPTTAILNG